MVSIFFLGFFYVLVLSHIVSFFSDEFFCFVLFRVSFLSLPFLEGLFKTGVLEFRGALGFRVAHQGQGVPIQVTLQGLELFSKGHLLHRGLRLARTSCEDEVQGDLGADAVVAGKKRLRPQTGFLKDLLDLAVAFPVLDRLGKQVDGRLARRTVAGALRRGQKCPGTVFHEPLVASASEKAQALADATAGEHFEGDRVQAAHLRAREPFERIDGALQGATALHQLFEQGHEVKQVVETFGLEQNLVMCFFPLCMLFFSFPSTFNRWPGKSFAKVLTFVSGVAIWVSSAETTCALQKCTVVQQLGSAL